MTRILSVLAWFTLWSPASLLAGPADGPEDWMPREEDRTGLWWTDGPPSVFGSSSPPASQTLSIRSGTRILLFDTARVRPVGEDWECAAVADGERFTCVGHVLPKDEWSQPIRFVETGRFFQRLAIEGLKFADADGKLLPGDARLEISAWPDRMAFRLETDAEARLELRYGGRKATGRGSVLLDVAGEDAVASVESELSTRFDEALGCRVLSLPEVPWSNADRTYYPREHLDRVDRWRVTLRNDSEKPAVARLMFTQARELPITGFTPMLCDPDGTPTGIPVQISKNWHRRPDKGTLRHEGPWFHGCCWVRVPAKSRRDFAFQMVYARYGGVCAASHSQLSLIGWGHNQFWDEAAIGSFGESICFEPGRVQRRCFIDDVRPLMTLPHDGPDKPWGWAENCGGGDFLVWQDETGRYRPQRGTRTDYRAYGPCLTDVGYSEETDGGEIAARMDVSVPRANDHVRTFFHIRYDVRKPIRWRRLAFFQLGADFYNATPSRRAAIGDAAGLREEWTPGRSRDAFDRVAVPLTGEQPWVSIHGLERPDLKEGEAAASRALIVRSWRAVLEGKPAPPSVSFYGNEWGKGNHRTVAELAPPAGVHALRPGDFVEADLELVVFPADAAAYYGPDEAFRDALDRDADTGRLALREAAGNALKVRADRGRVLRAYPLLVAVDEDQHAEVAVEGGVGHVPVTFTGLARPRGRRVLVDGTPAEYPQTDWLPASRRWQVTYNIAPPRASGKGSRDPANKNRTMTIRLD